MNFNFNYFVENLFEDGWWMFQDDQLVVRNRLRELFGNQVVALNHTVEWRSLSRLDNM